MSGQIIGSNKLTVNLQHQPGPLADPTAVTIPMPGGVSLVVFGGLTKLEALAGMIAIQVKDPASAVDRAQAVLDECQKRQVAHVAEAPPPPPQSPQSPKF